MGKNEIAHRRSGRVEVNPDALRVTWTIPEISALDANTISGSFSCAVRALPDKAEVKMLEESLLVDVDVLTPLVLSEHYRETILSAVTTTVESHPAEDWLSREGRERLAESLRTALQRPTFACGIAILPPFQIELISPSLQRQRTEAMRQQMNQLRLAGQVEHLAKTADVLKQFNALRAASPELPAGRILQLLGQNDQAGTVQSLLAASTGQTKPTPLWAVAGPYLIKVHLDTLDSPRIETYPLPATLGPARSVQRASINGISSLLIGARAGLLVVNPDMPASEPTLYPADTQSQLGCNRAIELDGKLYASHSEVGVLAWSVDSPGTGTVILSEPARCLAHLGSSCLLVSAGANLLRFMPGQTPHPIGGTLDVVDLISHGDRVLAIYKNGTLGWIDHDSEQTILETTISNVTAGALLPWMDDTRILLASEGSAVLCVGLNDSIQTSYRSAYREIRMLEASSHHICAVSSDRQRLIVWNSWDGTKPTHEIHLSALAKHRIADIAFV